MRDDDFDAVVLFFFFFFFFVFFFPSSSSSSSRHRCSPSRTPFRAPRCRCCSRTTTARRAPDDDDVDVDADDDNCPRHQNREFPGGGVSPRPQRREKKKKNNTRQKTSSSSSRFSCITKSAYYMPRRLSVSSFVVSSKGVETIFFCAGKKKRKILWSFEY